MVLVGAGGDRRVKKIVREPKWSRSSQSVIVLESEDGNKGTLHQKRVRQRRKSLTDTRMTLRSLPETLQTTALPSSLLFSSPAPSTYMLHVVTTDIYLHISGYSSARGILCACVFLVQLYLYVLCSVVTVTDTQWSSKAGCCHVYWGETKS